MIEILNGFQCEKCKTIYASQKDAEECENKPLETPLVPIGTEFIEEYMDATFPIRISHIYFNQHEVCYGYEMLDDGEWSHCSFYCGNEFFLEAFGDQLEDKNDL